MRKHPNGRVDQLEDRYLGMVEAPSSNLGTSTPLLLIDINGVVHDAKTVYLLIASVFGSARPFIIAQIFAIPSQFLQHGTIEIHLAALTIHIRFGQSDLPIVWLMEH